MESPASWARGLVPIHADHPQAPCPGLFGHVGMDCYVYVFHVLACPSFDGIASARIHARVVHVVHPWGDVYARDHQGAIRCVNGDAHGIDRFGGTCVGIVYYAFPHRRGVEAVLGRMFVDQDGYFTVRVEYPPSLIQVPVADRHAFCLLEAYYVGLDFFGVR